MAGFTVSCQIDKTLKSEFLVKCHLTTRTTLTWRTEKKKSPKGSQCLVHFAFLYVCLLVGWFVLFFLKMKQRKSKSNLSFLFREHWGRGKETAKYKFVCFFFFPLAAYFEVFSNKFGSTLGWRLWLVPHTSDLMCSPLLKRWLLLSPLQPTPTGQGRRALWIRACRRWVCLFSATSALRIGMKGAVKRGNSFSQEPFFFLRVK